jgi:hypothetical protein
MNKKIVFKIVLLTVGCFTLLSFGTVVFAQATPAIQTNSATNIQNNSATLNSNIINLGSSGNTTVWFQYGTTLGYGSQTTQQTQTFTGLLSQNIAGLNFNTTYHFRAVAQNGYGIVYGQDMTFITGQTNGGILTSNAGSDLYLTSAQTSILQGSGYDPSGSYLNYLWTCTGGTLSSYNIAQPTYTAPYAINGNNQATYTCALVVSNNNGISGSDSVTIYVNYNNGVITGNNSVQTNFATNIQNNSATLNGYLSGNGSYAFLNGQVWFQYGTSTSYGNTSFHQTLNYSGQFSQEINNLLPNSVYHFRAVAQINGSTVYGPDVAFNSSGLIYGNGTLSVQKQVINLTSGNLSWQPSVNAKPGDILSFAITLQANGQDFHNVVVADSLSSNLVYKGNLTVNAALDYLNNPVSGINVGTISAGGIEIIAYQAQVISASSLPYGITTLNNSATIVSREGGSQTASAGVVISNSVVQGATDISTGLTNNPVKDSFLLPVMLIILGSWFYFSGNVYRFADWIETKL